MESTDVAPLNNDADERHRGVYFCKGGKEQDVAAGFRLSFPEGRVIVPTRTRYRRKKDIAIEETVSLLPGYVFFELAGADREAADKLDARLMKFARTDSVLKLLRYSDGNWRLQGSDDRFAQMLFGAGGNIGISRAYFDQGNRIRILEGFLKDYEGSIIRVNRKAKTVEIRVDFQEKKLSLWLGYEQVSATDQ